MFLPDEAVRLAALSEYVAPGFLTCRRCRQCFPAGGNRSIPDIAAQADMKASTDTFVQ